jgi:hypothetical protein
VVCDREQISLASLQNLPRVVFHERGLAAVYSKCLMVSRMVTHGQPHGHAWSAAWSRMVSMFSGATRVFTIKGGLGQNMP